jgi:hypothetical protein
MHWAAHGHTAAEIIAKRADATRPTMGLTSCNSGSGFDYLLVDSGAATE